MTDGSSNELKFHGLRVCYSNDIRGNFIRLPSSIVNTLETTGITIQEFGFKVCQGGKALLHVGWDGHESQGFLNGEPAIEINPTLVERIKLRPTSPFDLYVSRYDQSKTADQVSVEPETSDDWEIIESHAMFFQDEILHQTRIVALGETLLCYIDNVVCRFTIKNIEPGRLKSARISTGSLVVISPRENKARAQSTQMKVGSHKLRSLEQMIASKSTVKRSIYGLNEVENNSMYIYMHVNEVPSKLACVSIMVNSLDLKHQGKHEKQEKISEHAKKVVVAVQGHDDVHKGHVAMSSLVWEALWAQKNNGFKIIIEAVAEPEHQIDAVDVKVTFTNIPNDERIEKNRRDAEVLSLKRAQGLFEQLSKGPITDRTVFYKHRLLVELINERTGEHVPFVNFQNSTSPKWRFSEDSKHLSSYQLPNQESQETTFLQSSLKDDYLPSDVTRRILDYLMMPVLPSSGVLLTGNGGTGKTTVLKELTKALVTEKGKHVKYFDCNLLPDSSNIGKMKQQVQEWCALCYWYSPAVLILDNAESLVPSIKSDDPQQLAMQQRGGSNSTRLALFLIKLVEGMTKKSSDAIRVVFSCHNRNELNSILFDKHFIGDVFKQMSPNVDKRGNLLEFYVDKMSNHLTLGGNLQIRDIALATDGFSPLDLQALVDKLLHQALMTSDTDADIIALDKAVFEEVIKDFSPSALRGVKLTKSTGTSWKDIGALEGPKKVLLETLEWPTKYAPIFKNCPLQLRSGVLLYGYPGCGKTLLASAVAQQCGLNFITVNGPEILNKYIGASEQNVRELFERAQSVKPCVLFFDEFDSIAPKRGHDSTGVTDRIVNQLLTQMDGVEGLDGVYVLAATSRPDLIDSALLRPGRIDKSVLCNVPGPEERLDILHTITSSGKMALEPGTDLAPVAEQTAGYSGADLQGLAYNAYLKSVHRALLQQNPDDSRSQDSRKIEYTVLNRNDVGIVIPERPDETEYQHNETSTPSASTQLTISLDDLLQACQETKPSISTTEFLKLQAIYQKFQDDRDGDMPPGEASNDIGTRTSLM